MKRSLQKRFIISGWVGGWMSDRAGGRTGAQKAVQCEIFTTMCIRKIFMVNWINDRFKIRILFSYFGTFEIKKGLG